MRRRYILLITLGLILPVVGVILLFWIENWRGARAWEGVRRELAARGELLDCANFIPPPVADGENLALAPSLLHAESAPPPAPAKSWRDMPGGQGSERPRLGRDNWMAAHPLPLAKWQQYYAKSKEYRHPQSPGEPAADVLTALAEFAPLLDGVVRDAAGRPQSRLTTDWKREPPIAIWIPQVSLYMRLTETLRLRASAELASAQPVEAWHDTAAALRLCAALGHEPTMSGFLADCSCTAMALQPVWEGLAARRWTAEQLRDFQEILRRDDHLATYVQAARWDRAAVCSTMESMRASSANGEMFFSGGTGKPSSLGEELFAKVFTLMPRGWIDQNKAVICRLYQQYIDAVDLRTHTVSLPEVNAVNAEALALSNRPYLIYTLVARMAGTWTTVLVQRAARLQTACDEAVVACALERYFLEYREYPAALGALVPAYLDRVPLDVIDGAPLRYRRTGDGRYLLYGIGWNGRDDGGTVAWQVGGSERYPSRPDDKEGDWVWQYTALDPPAGMW